MLVDAIDTSLDMLMIAKEKTHNYGLHINYTAQDMRAFKSHSKYSIITCINDGVNYLTTLEDIEAFFNSCASHMESGAFLLFDISTKLKLKSMHNQVFAEDGDDFAYIWFNEFNERKKLLYMELTFFTQTKDDIFRRSSELHVQRAHEPVEIESLLQKCGFALINTYGDLSSESPDEKSERIHFLAQKI